jgi:hypothetical protein
MITGDEGPPRFGHGVEPGSYQITLKYQGDQGEFTLESNVANMLTKNWVCEKSVADLAAHMFGILQDNIKSPVSRTVQSIARS